MTGISACRLAGKRVFAAGHRDMVGSALVRRFTSENCTVRVADRRELDFAKAEPAVRWLEANRPEIVTHTPAKAEGLQRQRICLSIFSVTIQELNSQQIR